MPGLFEQLKNLVKLKEYVELETGTSAKRVGDGSWRLNPCPFCSHNDSFTISEKGEFFRCFSCGAKGDIVEFERQYSHLDSPLQAAKSIAAKRGIQDGNMRVSKPGQKQKQKESVEGLAPMIDSARASNVRQIAAEYYHGRFMGDRQALFYQVDVRQHSEEVLKQLMVGLGGGNLIGHCKAKGVSVEELAGVGLVQAHKGGWRATATNGVYVYPHTSQGEVLFFSLKDPEKRKRWQLEKKFAPEEWICYGQDELDQDEPVIIVEGENDRITVMDRGEYPHVIATIASYNEPAILERLKETARGRTWYLAFDNDPPLPNKLEGAGASYTRIYANTILAAGGKVRVIRIEAGKDGKKVDIDDVLRAAKDPASELALLMDKAGEITKPIPDPKLISIKLGGAAPIPPPPDHAYKWESFEVLGELEDERILFWSRVNERQYAVALRDFNLDKLVQIGGAEVAARVARSTKTMIEGQLLIADVKKRIIVEAGKRQLWDPEYLGQGVHHIPDKKILLLVIGGRAWLWDGKGLEEWNSSVIDGRLIERKQGFDWVDFSAVRRELEGMDRDNALKIQDEFFEFVCAWGFRGRMDAWLLTGWHLAQYLQAMWPWRPHLWMTGSAGSGKTLMNELLGTISGKLALRCEGQTLTEPGLRQSVGYDSVLIFIDEIEKSQKRDEIIYYIRSAGRSGGYTRKGTSNQKAVKAQIRHMVFLSSIERGQYGAAENSRYLTIETQKSEEFCPVLPSSSQAETMRIKIVAYVLWAAFRARSLVKGMVRIKGHDPRFVESLAVAFSMIAVANLNPEEVLLKMLTEYLEIWAKDQAGERLEDEERLFKAIIGSSVHLALTKDDVYGEDRQSIYADRSISQLLSSDLHTKDVSDTLEALGIRGCRDGLFVDPEIVGRKLLRNSSFQGLNVGSVLSRIEGAEKKQRTLAGSRPRGILIPIAYCINNGMDVKAWK